MDILGQLIYLGIFVSFIHNITIQCSFDRQWITHRSAEVITVDAHSSCSDFGCLLKCMTLVQSFSMSDTLLYTAILTKFMM